MKKINLLIGFALILTCVYIYSAWQLIIFDPFHEREEIFRVESVSLNELGDFLAGVFSPLAFLWFVLTLFVQHSELATQNAELKLMTEVTREELENVKDTNKHQKESNSINILELIEKRIYRNCTQLELRYEGISSVPTESSVETFCRYISSSITNQTLEELSRIYLTSDYKDLCKLLKHHEVLSKEYSNEIFVDSSVIELYRLTINYRKNMEGGDLNFKNC